MSRDAKAKKIARRDREHERLGKTVKMLHEKGPHIKRMLRQRGVDLPFYDLYDSYFEEFRKVAAEGKHLYPSLLDVVELEDKEYFGNDRASLVSEMEQISWTIPGELNGYGTGGGVSNINGCTVAFRAQDGSVRTHVAIRKVVPNAKPHREFKYVFKLIALLHELGHVEDMERQINFNHDSGTSDMIEAEVYAHLYALRRMAERNYLQCFNILVDALQTAATANNYLKDVAMKTLARMPSYDLVDVSTLLDGPASKADLVALGRAGRAAFGVAE